MIREIERFFVQRSIILGMLKKDLCEGDYDDDLFQPCRGGVDCFFQECNGSLFSVLFSSVSTLFWAKLKMFKLFRK